MKPGIVLDLAASAARVASRRARLGPRRPSWSFGFETLVEGMRAARRKNEALPIVEQRSAWDAMGMPSPVLRAVRFTPATGFAVPCTWCHAGARAEGGPIVVFFHGGAYNFGSLATYGEMVARIALASGARVLFVDYRLAPEHPFPAATDDAIAVYREVLRMHGASRVVVAGDSAGGGLSLATMIRARDEGMPLPRAAVLVCPWVDLGDENHEEDPDDWITGAWGTAFGDAYRGATAKDHPYVSPARASLSGLPPTLVQVGTAELLHPQVVALAGALAASGVDVELDVARDMVHDWHFFAGLYPAARVAFESIGRFVRASTTPASDTASGGAREHVDRREPLVHI